MTSVVYFNGDALQQCGVTFQPWPFREDVQLNCEASEAGLHVIKFNSFVVIKDKSPPLPRMVLWDESCQLSTKDPSVKRSSEKVDRESFELTSKFLKQLKPITRDVIKLSPDQSGGVIEQLQSSISRLHQTGTHLVGVDGRGSLEEMRRRIHETAFSSRSGKKQKFGIIRTLVFFIDLTEVVIEKSIDHAWVISFGPSRNNKAT